MTGSNADWAAWNAACDQLDPATPKIRDITRADQAALKTPTTLAAHLWRNYQVRAHLTVVGEEIRAIHDGEGDRLLLTMPPQCGKTITAVVWSAFWWLCLNPGAQLMLISYNDQLAVQRGHAVRKLVEEFGARYGLYLDPSSRAKHEWMLTTGGGMRSLGIGSGITGNPADIIWIDDPHKNREEAESAAMRQKVHDSWSSDIISRLAPFTPVIVVQCMTGDTPVLRPDGTETPLRDIRTGDRIATYERGALAVSTVRNWANQGPDNVYAIKMKSGAVVRANARHPFLVVDDEGHETWRRVADLSPGVSILRAGVEGGPASGALPRTATSPSVARGSASPTTTVPAGPPDTVAGMPSRTVAHTSDTATASIWKTTTASLPSRGACAPSVDAIQTTREPQPAGVALCVSTTATIQRQCADSSATIATSWSDAGAPRNASAPEPSTWNVKPDQVVEIIPAGVEDVFDIQVDRTENFIANGLVSHNTRWHEDDLAGRRIREEGRVEQGGRWRVVNMPAFCTDPYTDPLQRMFGEPLPHPKIREGDTQACARHWNDKKAGATVRDWFALWQGDPRPTEGALLSWEVLRERRCYEHGRAGCSQPKRIGVAIDPSGGGRDTAGIIGGYLGEDVRLYFTHDRSGVMSSDMWGRKACELAAEIDADFIVVETNYGGDQATLVIRTSWEALRREKPARYSVFCPRIVVVKAKTGKRLRAEPIAQQWIEDRCRTAQYLPDFEAEWATWQPDSKNSPGRIDAGTYLAYEMLPIPVSGQSNVADPANAWIDLTRGLTPGDMGLIR